MQPGHEQRGLFNLDGYTNSNVTAVIRKGYQTWQGNEARLEHIQRAMLWCYVAEDDAADVSFEGALSRMSV